MLICKVYYICLHIAVPVHKSDDSRTGNVISRDDNMYSQKDPHGAITGMFSNLLHIFYNLLH